MGSLIEVRRRIMLVSPHMETVQSGNTSDSVQIAAFRTDMATKLKSLKVYFSPVQSGSGDPSPDNVRPITGHTGLTVKQTGVNMLQCDTFTNGSRVGVTFSGTRNTDGEIESITMKGTGTASNAFRNLNYNANAFKLMDGIIAFNAFSSQANIQPSANIIIKAEDGTTMNTHTYAGWYVYNLNQADYTHTWARIQAFPYNANGIEFDTTVYPMMCLAQDKGCNYEPYTGQEIPISWSGLGTKYGGYVDLVSGELIVEWENIANYDGESLPGEWISSKDKYVSGTVPTSGAQVVYKLTTPQTYQLAPQTIKTLIGRNNIWSDVGDVEVQYWKH